MLSKKLFLIALMSVALLAGAIDATEVLHQKRATCLPLGSSCSVIPDINRPRCCTFLVCDLKNARCKSGLEGSPEEDFERETAEEANWRNRDQ
ncbi:hypothetical protein KI688_004237 [Linnemannia hyalina]|uniref:Uncharacterized protein n=1 Tax=Linnemannia hyalina TaxID=64524 RepID=A0A9P8BPG9_9FUNG|nr:hypothetical protein KI688_004237 [Linnemannia hyalina]